MSVPYARRFMLAVAVEALMTEKAGKPVVTKFKEVRALEILREKVRKLAMDRIRPDCTEEPTLSKFAALAYVKNKESAVAR